MPWESLGEFELINEWIFSRLIEGEIFRILHRPIAGLSRETSLRAVIAQGFLDEAGLNRFSSKIFTYNDELEVFTFYFPVGVSEHSIIFKRLDKNNIPWFVELQMFVADNPEEDYQNYLITRFGTNVITRFSQTLITSITKNMSLYPLLFSGSTTPSSETIKLVANKATKLLSSNDSRTQLRIYSTGHPILLATNFDENGQPVEKLLQLPPNYYHEDVITSAGMYKGDIYAIAEQETYITVIEFSAK